MRNKDAVITTIICILPILLGVLVYDTLPATIAVHFDSSGAGDGFMPKSIVVFGLPLLFAALNLYLHFRIATDPKNANISMMLRNIMWWVVPTTAIIIMPITLFLAMGMSLPIVLIVRAMVGVLVIAVGNYFPKCKKNYTIGIRLPWTLSDDDNWYKTHRFAGFLWTIGGFVLLLTAIFSVAGYIVPVTVAFLIILPFIYSYTLHKKSK